MRTFAVILWCAGLAAALGAPGADPTRDTVRLALVYYAAALMLMLLLRPAEWVGSGRGRLARCCWTLAWAAYVIHVAAAFHFHHHWSHAEAVAHTERESGFGEGIYFSHLFTLLWTADVAWWWLRPEGHASRPAWVDALLHGYMLFIVFNATVVFGTGPVRWAGAGLFAVLALLACRRLLPARRPGGAYNLSGSPSSHPRSGAAEHRQGPAP